MKDANTKKRYASIIDSCIKTFCVLLEELNGEMIYSMLSPNMRHLTITDKHVEKYKKVFIYGRKVSQIYFYQLVENEPGILNAIIIFAMVPAGEEKSTKQFEFEDLNYRVYRFRFINIDDHWYIDEASLYNEFCEEHREDFLKLAQD